MTVHPRVIPVASLAALLAAAFFPISLHAQTFPAKPIRVLVGFTPGAGVDIAVRLIGPKMGDALGQSIIVDNLTSSGLVDGDATVSQRCHLKETAHLQGSLKTFRLAMDDGATFAGALEISKPANIVAPKPAK